MPARWSPSLLFNASVASCWCAPATAPKLHLHSEHLHKTLLHICHWSVSTRAQSLSCPLTRRAETRLMYRINEKHMQQYTCCATDLEPAKGRLRTAFLLPGPRQPSEQSDINGWSFTAEPGLAIKRQPNALISLPRGGEPARGCQPRQHSDTEEDGVRRGTHVQLTDR